MKLKPLLFIAGAAGAIAAIAKSRAGGQQPAYAAQQRYEPPAEGLAQPPVEAGGPPSDATPVTQASPRTPESGEQLNEPEHGPPGDAVMPDTSDDDPLVRQQEKAAAGDAGSIGGSVDQLKAEDASYPDDPAMRPVVEGMGDENEETFETREDVERGNRETET